MFGKKRPSRAGVKMTRWTSGEVTALITYASMGSDVVYIAQRLPGRTEKSVSGKINRLKKEGRL
jgi:hypothetical protein